MSVDTFPVPRRVTSPLTSERVGAVVRRHERVLALSSVLVLMFGSAVLRVGALRFHFWVDEGISAGIASHPLGDIPALLRQDGSPPLYYMLLHLWMGLRGSGEVATHELSLAFALLTIPAAYALGAGVFDRRVGVLCAALAAGTPFLTAYGQETRMYSLLALLSLMVAASFVQSFVVRRRRYLPVFVASLSAAMYTHGWALFLGLMVGIAFLLCVRAAEQSRRGLWRDGVLAFGGVALLYAPWVPTLIFQVTHTGAPWSEPPVLWSLTAGSYALTGGRAAAVALLLGGGSGVLAVWRSEEAQTRERLAALCLLLLGLGTLLIAWLYSKVSPAWAVRYLAVIVGPMILLFGLGLARAGRLGLVAVALAGCFWILDPGPTSANTKSNVAAALDRVRPELRPGTLVISTQPEQVPTLAYYLPGVSRFGTPLGLVPDPRIMDWRDALARMRRSTPQRVLAPMLRSLAPGQQVMLVAPLSLQGHAQWLKLIRRYSTQWSRALVNDHSLRRVSVTSVHSGAATLPVRVTLFARRRTTGRRAVIG